MSARTKIIALLTSFLYVCRVLPAGAAENNVVVPQAETESADSVFYLLDELDDGGGVVTPVILHVIVTGGQIVGGYQRN